MLGILFLYVAVSALSCIFSLLKHFLSVVTLLRVSLLPCIHSAEHVRQILMCMNTNVFVLHFLLFVNINVLVLYLCVCVCATFFLVFFRFSHSQPSVFLVSMMSCVALSLVFFLGGGVVLVLDSCQCG